MAEIKNRLIFNRESCWYVYHRHTAGVRSNTDIKTLATEIASELTAVRLKCKGGYRL